MHWNVTSITNNASGLKKKTRRARALRTCTVVYTFVKEEWPCVGDLDRFLQFILTMKTKLYGRNS